VPGWLSSSARAVTIVVSSNLGQLPVAMRTLILVLLGREVTGSYVVAGLGATLQSRPTRSWCGGADQVANTSTIALQKAGRSSGLRLVTMAPSTWTCSSTQVPPALPISVRRLGHDVRVRPRTTPASISVHGPWQIAATGRPDCTQSRKNDTDASSRRSWSGLATPPGSTTPSYSSRLNSDVVRSTGSQAELANRPHPGAAS
jgi:hypothetical protein